MKDITTEEATKIIKNFIDYFNKNKNDGNKANLCVLGEEIKAIEKVLNELKKYDEGKIVSVKLIKKFYLISRDEKNQKSIADVTFFEKYAPKEILEKKDKIINAMAKEWFELDSLFMIRGKNIHSKEELKQYFEKEVIDE